MAQHNEKNVTETHAVVGQEVSKFIRSVNDYSHLTEIKAAAEHTPAKVTGNRTFAEIAIDDAIDAFENIVADIKRQVPDVKETLIPVEIYQQLLDARYGENKKVSRDEAKKALHGAIQEKLSSLIIKEPGAPVFVNVLTERVRGPVVLEMTTLWYNLVDSMSQLFRNEEAIIADKTAFALQVALSDQFNNANDDDGIRVIHPDGLEDGTPEMETDIPVMHTSGSGRANDNLPALLTVSPKLRQLLQKADGEDLTDMAKKGQLPTIFGRIPDMQNIVEILLQKEAPHAMLHGEEGVGMTATVHGLAQRIASGKVPQKLKDATVISISMSSIIHDSKGGMGEPGPHDILRMILEETAAHNKSSAKRIVLHIEDMGTDTEQTNPIVKQYASIMRSVMAHTVKHNSANLSIVFEIPQQHLDVMKSTDPLVLKTFTPVELKPLPKNDVMDFLNHNAPKLAAHHGIAMPDDILEYLYKKTDKFMPNLHHPAKDIATLGSVLASAEANGEKQIVEDNVDTVIAKRANLPKTFVGSDISDRIDGLKDGLMKRIFGQDHAVKRIADTIALVNEGLHDTKKPLGSFMLIGPTGVGKTEMARSLAALLFDDEEAVIRVDMGQFHDKHTISRLVGSPPGYVGYGDKCVLDEIEKRPFSVVLLDEQEKSHPDVDNALLPILDDGILTKMDGKKLNFRNAVFILTSNIGARAAEQAMDRKHLGFGEDTEEEKITEVQSVREDAIKTRLKPEFRGRTTVISLDYLSPEVGEKIALKKIREVGERLHDNKRYKDVKINISPAALQQLMVVGYDKRKGARQMDQAVREYVKEPLNLWLKENKDSIVGRSATLTIESIQDKKDGAGFRVSTQFPSVPAVIPPRAASGPT